MVEYDIKDGMPEQVDIYLAEAIAESRNAEEAEEAAEDEEDAD